MNRDISKYMKTICFRIFIVVFCCMFANKILNRFHEQIKWNRQWFNHFHDFISKSENQILLTFNNIHIILSINTPQSKHPFTNTFTQLLCNASFRITATLLRIRNPALNTRRTITGLKCSCSCAELARSVFYYLAPNNDFIVAWVKTLHPHAHVLTAPLYVCASECVSVCML